MSTESIFTIIAILLSVYTLIPIEEKKLIGLKFTRTEIAILILSSIYVLFLILLFEHFVEWYDSWKIFTSKEGLSSNEYAFLFSLAILIYLGYKVLKSNFPKRNRAKLLDYYKYLARKEKYNLLYDLIIKYEFDTLIKIHFKKGSNLSNEEIQNYEVLLTIFDDLVVENFTKSDPYFYSKFLDNLQGEHRFIESMQHYYKVLISNQSSPLIREIRDNKTDNLLLDNKPLLSGIIGDPKIAGTYKIYQPIGDYCKEIIRIERDNFSYSQYNRAYYSESVLWAFPITHCIHFFNLMINASISQKHNDFLWLNYYERFVQMICENIDTTKLNGEEKISEFPTYNHRLIYDIIDNTVDWLKFVDENYFEDCISPSILTSLFSSLTYLAESSNFEITEQFRSKRFESAIRIYFDVNEQIQNQYSEAIISRFGSRSESFKDLFGTAWESVVDDKWAGRPFDHEIPDVEKYIKDVIEKLDISTEFRGDWLKSN